MIDRKQVRNIMKKFSLPLVLVFSLLAISGCRKDNSGPSDSDKGKIIVGKTWKMTAFTVDGKDEYSDFYEDCERDNTEEYFADGRLVIDEGATKCEEDDSQTMTQNWRISGNALVLFEEGVSIELECTILELTNTTLKYSLVSPFTEEKYLYTYTAQ